MLSDRTKNLIWIFAYIDVFCRFFLGISEAFIVGMYKRYEHECYNIWYFVLASCITDILYDIIFIFAICASFKERKTLLMIFIGKLINFAIMITSVVIYHNIDNQCNTFWLLNAPETQSIVLIQYSMLWITIALICIPIIIDYCFCEPNDKPVANKKSVQLSTISVNNNHQHQHQPRNTFPLPEINKSQTLTVTANQKYTTDSSHVKPQVKLPNQIPIVKQYAHIDNTNSISQPRCQPKYALRQSIDNLDDAINNETDKISIESDEIPPTVEQNVKTARVVHCSSHEPLQSHTYCFSYPEHNNTTTNTHTYNTYNTVPTYNSYSSYGSSHGSSSGPSSYYDSHRGGSSSSSSHDSYGGGGSSSSHDSYGSSSSSSSYDSYGSSSSSSGSSNGSYE